MRLVPAKVRLRGCIPASAFGWLPVSSIVSLNLINVYVLPEIVTPL